MQSHTQTQNFEQCVEQLYGRIELDERAKQTGARAFDAHSTVRYLRDEAWFRSFSDSVELDLTTCTAS
jgi:hypothetical protein